jgi:hypothetical protein
MGSKLNQEIIQRILQSIYFGNSRYTAIWKGTAKPEAYNRRTGKYGQQKVKLENLKPYLNEMVRTSLIKVERQGERDNYSITEKGMKCLLNTSVLETFDKINTLTVLLEASKKSENQILVANYRDRKLITRNKYWDERQFKNKALLDKTNRDIFKVRITLQKAIKNLYEALLFFEYEVPNPEDTTNSSWIIFKPGMTPYLALGDKTEPEFEKLVEELAAKKREIKPEFFAELTRKLNAPSSQSVLIAEYAESVKALREENRGDVDKKRLP